MEMGVRDFQADDGKAAPVAVKGFFDGKGDWFGKKQEAGQVLVGDIKEPVHLQPGHHERMAFPKRMDVQEGKKILIFRNLIGRYFSGDDL
jgi:hypothetical protein